MSRMIRQCVLYRTKDTQTSDMGVFTTHVIGSHDDLQNVRIHWVPIGSGVQWQIRKVKTCHSQSITFLVGFGGYIEGYPAIGLFERHEANILKVTGTCASTYG